MARINPKAAEQLRGAEVDSWCEWLGLDPDDDIKRVNLIAKLILVDWDENQCYELWCRSGAPGRPLKFMRRFWGNFPTADDLDD